MDKNNPRIFPASSQLSIFLIPLIQKNFTFPVTQSMKTILEKLPQDFLQLAILQKSKGYEVLPISSAPAHTSVIF